MPSSDRKTDVVRTADAKGKRKVTLYSPSLVSQVLVVAGGLGGFFIARAVVTDWQIDGIFGYFLIPVAVVGLSSLGLFTHGYRLRFDPSSRSVFIETILMGFTLGTKTCTFQDVLAAELNSDADGFPMMTIRLSDGSSYWIPYGRTGWMKVRHLSGIRAKEKWER